MALTALGDTPAHTVGDLPVPGDAAPDFTLVGPDLAEITRPPSGRTILNIFPSIDTGVCAASVREFNERAASLTDTTVICASMDLPFAASRFCGAEGIDDVVVGSGFRTDFGAAYGVTLVDTVMQGLYARAVVVLDTDGTVLHTELVPSIGQEPDYDAAVSALG